MGDLGDLLRRTREEKGLSLDQATQATRIRKEFLQALEEESLDRLPGAVYVKGFLRNYAAYLGLDPQQVLSLLQTPVDAAPSTAPLPIAPLLDQPLEPMSLWRFWPVAALLVAIAVLVAGWSAYQRYFGGVLPFARPTPTPTTAPTATITIAQPSPTAVVPTATASPTTTRVPTVTPTLAGLVLSIEVVDQRSWVLVQADGERAFAGILEPGAKDSWTASQRIVLRSGNAGAVRVTLNGEDLGLFGETGQVVEQEWTAAGVPTRTPEATAAP
jgi:cytoskeletal protein RodZ